MNNILDKIELKAGSHASRDEGVCFMEAAAYIAGLPHSDRPACTNPVVAEYARCLNDSMPDDQRQRLKELLPLAATTPNGVSPEKRALLCADYAIRIFAASALKSAGLNEWADKLAGLPEIDSEYAARAAASYAADAASAAVRDADPWEKPIELLRRLLEMGHEL